MERYERNMKTLTFDENESLKSKKVCVVGCGGIGGYVIEMLARIGVGHITAVDGDVFEESNFNRQLLSDEKSIGVRKAEKAKLRIKDINSEVEVTAIAENLTIKNGEGILKGHDVVVDALDSVEARFLLQNLCEKLNIPMVSGAIGGWYGQITTIMPGDRTLDFIYTAAGNKGIEKELGNPSFTPALAASIEACETVKLLINRGEILSRKILIVNLLQQEYEIIDIV